MKKKPIIIAIAILIVLIAILLVVFTSKNKTIQEDNIAKELEEVIPNKSESEIQEILNTPEITPEPEPTSTPEPEPEIVPEPTPESKPVEDTNKEVEAPPSGSGQVTSSVGTADNKPKPNQSQQQQQQDAVDQAQSSSGMTPEQKAALEAMEEEAQDGGHGTSQSGVEWMEGLQNMTDEELEGMGYTIHPGN